MCKKVDSLPSELPANTETATGPESVFSDLNATFEPERSLAQDTNND
jgi:hypothetical protein